MRDGDKWTQAEMEATNVAKIPTLSELIEACRKEGFSLAYGGIWRATKEYGYDIKANKFLSKSADGKTPEIAVAKLYIKLNEK